jgi:hypothetical protein
MVALPPDAGFLALYWYVRIKIRGITLAAAGAFLLASGCRSSSPDRFDPPARYVAVLLRDGQFYLGQRQESRADLLVLRDVCFLRTETDPRTGAPATRLVPRASEWHQPDRAVFRVEQVVSVEPVASGSDMAKAIRRLKNE